MSGSNVLARHLQRPRRARRRLGKAVAAGLLLVASSASAGPAEPPFAHCLASLAAPAGDASEAGSAVLSVEATDRSREVQRSRARVAWRVAGGETRILLDMLEPAEVAGSRVLLVERKDARPEAYAWLPEIAAVKRVGARHLNKPLFGTDITYADLERAGLLAGSANVEHWQEDEVDGRPAWRLESRDGRTRITSWLDQERCLPLRTEVADRKGRPTRRVELSPQPFSSGGSGFVPRSLRVRDLERRSETVVTLESLERDARLPDASDFDPANLAPTTLHASQPVR